jgi:hypothetical protein
VTLLPEWVGWLAVLDGAGMEAGVIRATTGGLDRFVAVGAETGGEDRQQEGRGVRGGYCSHLDRPLPPHASPAGS